MHTCPSINRSAHLGPVRSLTRISREFLSAPLGAPTICFMTAIGVSAFMAWNSQVTHKALQVYHK